MRHALAHLGLACFVSAVPFGAALAQSGGGTADSAKAGIYTCTTPDGRRLTSDRPIVECSSREQRVLNADGSLRSVLPAFMSPEERAAQEARDRRLTAERATQNDAVRRDRNLMQRFPNEASHMRARNSALDDANKAMRSSEHRLKDLALERKPLSDEAEFYKGRLLPAKLKQALDANDAGVDAQLQLIENQKAELVRINGRYDAELARLKRLWAGATPGSLGTMTMPTEAAAARH
ncbi:hypothetical protein BH11PSE10_BH11PSE10_15680 [soil metagenome]